MIVLSDRPARIKADIPVERPYPRHRGDPYLADLRKQILAAARTGRHMVTVSNHVATREPHRLDGPDHVWRATLLAKAFAERAHGPRPRRQLPVPEL